ncbi:SchA/CurD-like domain-containing protein [Kitasatospora camelliae]|uniref:SchA/CurD-like domain-containing protein n=1 Tax=Kitasatospora camelliae TaxID=3156397 RepID=A0AAU8K500_9ACTN
MTLLSESTDDRLSTPQDSRLRVVLFCDIQEGQQDRFLDAYEQLRYQVSAVPGHISDQLCQSIEDPSRWLITSEWESAEPFLTWVDSPAHREMVKPLHGCVRDTRSLRFSVMRETSGRRAVDSQLPPLAAGQSHPGVAPAPRPGPDGIIRHALTFTVKPGTEKEVARILAGYSSPAARVDDTTRLVRTSLFMIGNRVVRSVEVEGDLVAALRHVASQPEVRAVEEAINPYLEEARDLGDPLAARDFFMRAALPAVQHHARSAEPAREAVRHAFCYPVRTGCGAATAELLARQDSEAVDDPASPVVRSTVFQRADRVVRVVDLTVDPEADPQAALGIAGPRAAAVLARLVDLAAGEDPTDREGPRRLVGSWRMTPVTDRRAPGA